MRFNMPREFYVPKGAMKVADKNTDAVVYVYENGTKYGAVAFAGKAQKPNYHYTYTTEAKRADFVKRFFEARQQTAAFKAEMRIKRNKPHTFKVGDIVHTSWGYEQTNVDFYQVTATTPHTVKVRKISATNVEDTGWMQGTKAGNKDDFYGPETTHRANYGGFTIDGHSAHAWDGKPVHWTGYH